MSIFAAAVDAIFADSNIAQDAVLLPATPVRVIRRRPDDVVGFGDGQFVAGGDVLEVRRSEAPSLTKGAEIQIGDEVLVVRAAPRLDADRLVWTVEVAPA